MLPKINTMRLARLSPFFFSLFMEGGGSFYVQDYPAGAAAAFGPDGDFAAFCKDLEKLRL